MKHYLVQIYHTSGSASLQKVTAPTHESAIEWAERNIANVEKVIGVVCVKDFSPETFEHIVEAM